MLPESTLPLVLRVAVGAPWQNDRTAMVPTADEYIATLDEPRRGKIGSP